VGPTDTLLAFKLAEPVLYEHDIALALVADGTHNQQPAIV
jgi:hypothetical protein